MLFGFEVVLLGLPSHTPGKDSLCRRQEALHQSVCPIRIGTLAIDDDSGRGQSPGSFVGYSQGDPEGPSHQALRKPKLKRVKQIAIDEISIGKGHRYVTVVLDLDSGAVVFVGQGKSAAALDPFWVRLRAAHARIDAVATDMSSAYTAAVVEHLPDAVHVFDRFHVMKLFNHELSELRRELYREATNRLDKNVLKGIRWLLLMNRENLDEEKQESQRLREALELNASLAAAYYLKEDLREFWNQQGYLQAERFLDRWCWRAEATGIRRLQKLAHTIRRHRRGLLNWYLYPISTGPLEGTNAKIRVLQRQAYGYRDYQFFLLKIGSSSLFVAGPIFEGNSDLARAQQTGGCPRSVTVTRPGKVEAERRRGERGQVAILLLKQGFLCNPNLQSC